MEFNIKIDEKIDNLTVAKAINSVVAELFSKDTDNVAVIIGEGTVQIIAREPNGEMSKIELQEGQTVLTTTLKKEANTPDHASKIVVEWVLDMWLKYGVTYFYAEYSQRKSELSLFWNKSIDEKFIQSYWTEHATDGWNTEGLFWKRQWMRAEHQHSPGTGKTGRR